MPAAEARPRRPAVSTVVWERASPFNTQQLLARFGNQVMIEVNASYRLAGFEHEAPDTLEESPPSIFVNLKPGAARILDGDAPCIFHCPLRTCGRFGRAKATACLSWCKARVRVGKKEGQPALRDGPSGLLNVPSGVGTSGQVYGVAVTAALMNDPIWLGSALTNDQTEFRPIRIQSMKVRPLLYARRWESMMQRDKRTEGRSNVFLTAALNTGRVSVPVRIRNISQHGALIEGAAIPPLGAMVQLVRGSLAANGSLSWHCDGHAGVNFDGRIDVEAWVRRIGHVGQQRVDGIVAAIRRSEPVDSRDGETAPRSLAALSAELDEICDRLASANNLSLELAQELLKLDVVAQSFRDLTGRRR